ncbi:MAG: hypothetical protein ABIK20_07185 [Candidatus Omnitrophota bacterium]|nr:hypothetical protein [Candidatus Omnitrophota bacterium]
MKTVWEKITIRDLAAVISDVLRKNGIEVTLVGGACVSIYARNKYISYDLNFITESSLKELVPILNGLGFKRKDGCLFENPKCKFLIDFPMPPIAIGNEPVLEFNSLRTKHGIIILLTPTDCVKDRLAAYFFWNDRQALEQAVLVVRSNKVNLTKIRKWAESEGEIEKFKILKKKLVAGV